MPGPWEKYQSDSTGPWTKYGGGSDSDSGGVDASAAVQGFGNMATAGYLPEMTGAVGKLVPNPTSDTDAKLRAQGFTLNQDDSAGVTTDQSRAMQKQMANDSPYSYYGGGAAGAIASAPAYGAALKALGIARAVPQAAAAADAGLLTKAGIYAQNLGARALQAGKEGAAIGAIANPNTEEGQSGVNLGGRIMNAGAGGLLSSAIPVAGDLIKGGAEATNASARWGGTKLLSSLGGVKPEVINEYAQYADRINNAPSIESLKETSDNFVGKLAADVDAKKVSLDQAQKALDGFQGDLKDKYRAAGYDARDAVSSAQDALKDAHGARISQLSQDVGDAMGQLKDEVSKGSANAYNILAESGESIPVAPIKGQLTMEINGLKVGGKAPIGADEVAATNQLQAIRDTLDQYPKELPATEAKKMLQQLQRSTNYSNANGQFSEAADSALRNVNRALNVSLKNRVAGYGEAMEPVAANTQLLSSLNKAGFGDRQSAASVLQRLDSPTQAVKRDALEQLGKKYNADFINASRPESLPEYARLQKAQDALEAIRPDKVASKIDQTVGASRQQAAVSDAQSQLGAAQEKLAPFKSLAPNSADQTQAQQKLMQLAKGKNIELEDMFKNLGKLTDTDFVQAMKDHNIQAAFQKGATNGSRNTLMGALAGWLIGGPGGAAAGGAAGRAVDQWGPAITKKILDGAIAVSKNPTVSTIQNLSIPDQAKRAMVIQLENYMGQSKLPTTLTAMNGGKQPNRSPAKGEDLWAQSGISKLGIQDAGLSSRLLNDPKAKQLLIQASDLTPGSKAMKRIQDQLRQGWGLK